MVWSSGVCSFSFYREAGAPGQEGSKETVTIRPPRGEGAVLPPLAQPAPRHPLPPSRGLPPPLVAKARTVIPATASVM